MCELRIWELLNLKARKLKIGPYVPRNVYICEKLVLSKGLHPLGMGGLRAFIKLFDGNAA
jgi:hypothetical protein